MAEKHLDMNGKNIRIGDVVLVHHVERYCGNEKCKQCDIIEKLAGEVVIVVDFGCITVEMSNGKTIDIINQEKAVEVIGDVRPCKKSS